jgi:hypothetical protein
MVRLEIKKLMKTIILIYYNIIRFQDSGFQGGMAGSQIPDPRSQ